VRQWPQALQVSPYLKEEYTAGGMEALEIGPGLTTLQLSRHWRAGVFVFLVFVASGGLGSMAST
jgi:hypothetical protein